MKCSYLFFIVWYSLDIFWLKSGKVDAIIGGSIAEFNQFKSVVSIQANNEHICGGAIIGELHILTAAHCVINDEGKFINQKLSILAGVVHLRSTAPPAVRVDVETIYVPEIYKRMKRIPGTHYYPETADIAVLKLKHGVGLNVKGEGSKTNGNVLKIPDKVSMRYFNQRFMFSGFGLDDINRGVKRNSENVSTNHRYSILLKYAEAVVIRRDRCKAQYSFEIYDSQLCAYVVQKKTLIPEGLCNGDDGGPLISDDIVIGVLSQIRHDCNEQAYSSIYTKVANFKGFIKNAQKDFVYSDIRTAMYEKNTGNIVEFNKFHNMPSIQPSINLDLTL